MSSKLKRKSGRSFQFPSQISGPKPRQSYYVIQGLYSEQDAEEWLDSKLPSATAEHKQMLLRGWPQDKKLLSNHFQVIPSQNLVGVEHEQSLTVEVERYFDMEEDAKNYGTSDSCDGDLFQG